MNNLGFVHHFVPAPVASETNERPTLLLLHGTGGNEDSLLDWGRSLAPKDNLLSPRGHVLENGMPRFFRRLAEGVFDEEDLYLRATELAEFIGEASQHYGFDKNNVIAFGYSNGANIAAALLLLHPKLLKAAVLLRAMVPLALTSIPDLKDIPVFMASGQRDPLVPRDNAERLATMLRRGGAEVTLNWQDAGHALEAAEVASLHAWLAQNAS